MYSLGVDIGGTKVAAALIDDDCNGLFRVEHPSINTDREKMFQQVVHCIEKVLHKSRFSLNELRGIGVGVPGKVDTENGIAVFQNNLPWENFPLSERIKQYFHIENVVIDNDVSMATLAEWVGHGKNESETFVYFTVSTGISCCTIHNGNFVRGAGFAGEVGFLPVKFESTSGQYKELEKVASGPAIEKIANETDPLLKRTTKQVLQDYKSGELYAVQIMNEVFACIARGVYAISCLLDPHKLVLGGGVINHHPDLLNSIKKALKAYLIPEQMDLLNRMYVSRLKGDSGLIGAGLKAQLTHSIAVNE